MNTIVTEQTPTGLIRKLVAESRPEGGSIFLDDFCNQLPDAPRAECVAALKNNSNVLFIVGRKGHLSRVVFGRMKDDYSQAPSFKSPLAAGGPIRRHNHKPQVRAHPVIHNGTELDASAFRLRVMVQGQEVFVPVDSLELVPA